MRDVILRIFFGNIPHEHLRALPLNMIYAVCAALIVAGGVIVFDLINFLIR